MNFWLQINRGIIVLDALIRSRRYKKKKSKNVIIVFQQIFGDSIVIQNSLAEYTRIFPKADGWKIHFLARPSVIAFMESNLSLPNEIIFEKVDFKKFLEDYGYYKQVVKKYKDLAGAVVVPGTSFSAEIFTAVSQAEKKVGLIRSIDITKPWIMVYFYRKAYTATVLPNKEDMMLQRHRKLINYLGAAEFRSQLPELLEKNRVIEGHYAVMCPGSSRAEKCWPIERFAEVADYIIENYGLLIHLCGGTEEKRYEEDLMRCILPEHMNKIISHIGTTSFSDWSAIVQHADIVIGNDSATMHLAAAARIPSICIAGVYDKYQFFPYKVDELEIGDRLPVTILHDMPCEWCRTIGYDAGYGNEECKNRIKMGMSSTCINLITVDEVKVAIDNLMKESK